MAFSRPQAIGALAVDHDYRDDAQSASVVCRNQLWNPFSVVFVLRAGARSDVSVAQPVVSFVSRAVRHASLRRDVDLQDRHTSLEPGCRVEGMQERRVWIAVRRLIGGPC